MSNFNQTFEGVNFDGFQAHGQLFRSRDYNLIV